MMFQFQNGTIKAYEKIGATRRHDVFQFQNGTIKALELKDLDSAEARFNSKMVQLKPPPPPPNSGGVLPFQFQNGTIKACIQAFAFRQASAVSIPKWYN